MDIGVESSSSALRRAAEPSRLSPIVLSGVAAILEGALAIVAGLTFFYLYLGGHPASDLSRYEVAVILALQIQLIAFSNARLYDMAIFRRPFQFAGRILLVWTATFTVLVVIAFLTK